MKVYISADIEGVTGITHWDDATIGQWNYSFFQAQMQREVNAACEGAIAAGSHEIWVKDAHDSGRNLVPDQLPDPVKLIRGWSGHPYSMVQRLDPSFDAVVMVGYHSPASSGANPLAHTLTTEVNHIKVNGQIMSEFHLMARSASLEQVPVVFVAGDEALCQWVKAYDPLIEVVATNQGIGESVLAIHPEEGVRRIRQGVEAALTRHQHHPIPIQPLPPHFDLEIDYKQVPTAYAKSFYPGAKLVNDRTVSLQTEQWFDVMRALRFLVF